MAAVAIVDGHERAGKSTLIQRLLESNKTRGIKVSLCVPRGVRGTRASHPELKLWRDAGAMDVSVLRYDPRRTDVDSLIPGADDGFDAWDEWLLEAQNVGYSRVHCSVYVLRPLGDPARLVEDRDEVVAYIPFDEYLSKAARVLLPDESVEPVNDLAGETEIDLPIDTELPDKLAAAGLVLDEGKKRRLGDLIRDGVPIHMKQPALRAECARLPAAEVVVVNTHDERERSAAEATRAEILRLFSNWSLRYKLRFRSQVTRAGVYVANLRDASDAGTQKAIAQIKRKMRGRY